MPRSKVTSALQVSSPSARAFAMLSNCGFDGDTACSTIGPQTRTIRQQRAAGKHIISEARDLRLNPRKNMENGGNGTMKTARSNAVKRCFLQNTLSSSFLTSFTLSFSSLLHFHSSKGWVIGVGAGTHPKSRYHSAIMVSVGFCAAERK